MVARDASTDYMRIIRKKFVGYPNSVVMEDHISKKYRDSIVRSVEQNKTLPKLT